MGKKKTETKVVNTVGFAKQPENQDYTAARGIINNIDYTTPVHQSFGKLRNEIDESGGEFLGENLDEKHLSRIKQSKKFKSITDEGEAVSAAVGAENEAKFSGRMNLGDATKDVFYNTGATQTTTQPRDILGTTLSIANTGAKFAAM